MADLPTSARVVIIGGGVIGCSVAYHLTKLGWTDVVLLERKQLTSGTTWHAAGLIAQLRATANMTKLAKYSQELYGNLETETGVATGFKRVGSITVALTEERKEEIFRQASMARALARIACPLAWSSRTGLSGETAESASCTGLPSTAGSGGWEMRPCTPLPPRPGLRGRARSRRRGRS